MSLRTGLPVATTLLVLAKVFGNASHTILATRDNCVLVKPATAFCSWINTGIPKARAARPPGPAT